MKGQEYKEAFARRISERAEKISPTVEIDPVLPDFGDKKTTEEKVDWIASQLTIEEKIDFLSGVDMMAIRGNERLNLPRVWCSDASSGVRCFGPGTSFPALLALTATWNRETIRTVGEAIADECRAIGVSVLLGPGVNIYRIPNCGRNFEYMGEDPYLTGEMVVPYIDGVQSRGVAATVKHFACNNSDYDRHRMNAVVDERTLREIYLPAFKKAVQKGKVMALMSSYNPVNGTYASENGYLLNDILKKEWGFTGAVMSDWVSTYSTQGPVKGGLDLEMPNGMFLNRKTLQPLLEDGTVTEADIDEHVRRTLRLVIETGAYDKAALDTTKRPQPGNHRELARKAGAESIVLLKNKKNILPFDGDTIKRIVVIGPNSLATPTGGGGSSYVHAVDPVGIYDGLKTALDGSIEVGFVEMDTSAVATGEVNLGTLTEDKKAALREADAVVVCAGYNHVIESECYDRSWTLPEGQAELIGTAARLNPNTVVLVNAGGGFETESRLSEVAALVHVFYLGAESGNAVADVLTGAVNPSGKLPFTIAKRWEDHPASKNFPKDPDATSERLSNGPEVRRKGLEWSPEQLRNIPSEQWDIPYEEGLFVGYRHFDTRSVTPQFPFGFGLSYTTFALTNPKVSVETVGANDGLEVTVTVNNSGRREGAEVVQVYVADLESSLPRPEKELKGFAKVFLQAGGEKEVTVSLDPEAFRYYDPDKKAWTAEPGTFEIFVGSSSRDVLSAGTVELK